MPRLSSRDVYPLLEPLDRHEDKRPSLPVLLEVSAGHQVQ
jgi:hypothetical protein